MMLEHRPELLLPCGHRSVSLVCFECLVDEFTRDQLIAEKHKEAAPLLVPRELTIQVLHPPHLKRFGIGKRKR